ncbi:MAG: lysophospholipid acyltransferase family protein [Flavobacteriaceae bacterium]
MKYFLRKIILIIWRCWFYFLAAIPIIILFPILSILALWNNGYPHIFWIARNIWAPFILFGTGFYVKAKFKNKLPIGKTFLLVANHSSYIDPFVMLRVSKNPFVFVGKKELVKIPIFGFIYKRAAIMVDRKSSKSRWGVYERSNKVIKKGLSICIFPEKDYLDNTKLLNEFKRGAFKLSIDHQIPIVPMAFLDCKRKFPWHTNYGKPGKLRVETFSTIYPKKKHDKIENLQKTTRQVILNALKNDPLQKNKEAIDLEHN